MQLLYLFPILFNDFEFHDEGRGVCARDSNRLLSQAVTQRLIVVRHTL